MSAIKFLIMDVDGTLTDGKIYMSATGEIFKVFDIKDGCGIHDLLPKAGIIPVIITARVSSIVADRCKELSVEHCYQGCRDKAAKLNEFAEQFGLHANVNGVYQEIAYVGDDIIDIPCMRLCGVVGCPSDAVPEIREICDFVCTAPGGHGAVREFIEWLIRSDKD